MKKLHFLVLLAVLGLTACSKTDSLIEEKKVLLDEIGNIAIQNVKVTCFEDIIVNNCNNPYDAIGEITCNISIRILEKGFKMKTDADSLKSEFLALVANTLPESFQKLDTTDFSSIESIITDQLMKIYISEGFEIFVIKSKEIEDIICKTGYFNENQKARLLTFSSVMRHNINAINIWCEDNTGKRISEWEECFISKLRELQDCGNCFIERITCALSWPTCLGVKALDCAIDALIN